MAVFMDGDREILYDKLAPFFPLKDISSVINLLNDQISYSEPNLAVLSLICGFFEHELTNNKSSSGSKGSNLHDVFPIFEFDHFRVMYNQYLSLIIQKIKHLCFTYDPHSSSDQEDMKGEINSEHLGEGVSMESSRGTVKEIADFVWGQLSTSYFKDRPHLQSIYSFLNGKRLDCFGVAILVVTTAQQLGRNDVHLALSEDHAWVVFGKDGKETAEVTWHGKRDETKRGNPINQEPLVDFSKDWLYLGGFGMKCNRYMELAAIVSAMNPGIDSKTDSELLGRLQQDMLWHLFDHGHLDRYPMAICNLADLEEIEESRRSPTIDELYQKAITIAEMEYQGCHVYPYTYYGGFLHRQGRYSQATEQWKQVAIVASRYTHSREDEELYKDLHEVANTFFPEIIKQHKKLEETSSLSIEKDFFNSSETFLNIIRFYDGVCFWEEGGSTAAIHSEWAKNFSKLLSSFPQNIRVSCKEFLAGADPSDIFLKSQKMKLILNMMGNAKIKSQEVNLHLTSQIGLNSGLNQGIKRSSESNDLKSRSKRFR